MRIIYQNESGGCSVVVPTAEALASMTLDQVAAKVVPAGTPYKIVPATEIPSDRTYRNAWAADVVNGKINHDMVKAREIHKDHMRRVRKPLLEALDLEYFKHDEISRIGTPAEKAAANSALATVIAQKKALREVTANPGIAAATTFPELKQVWPTELGANPL